MATMSFADYFLPVLFCMLSMLISDSRSDLVWFRLSCDHEGFNDWGGRGYCDFVPEEVTKTAPSGDRTT